MDEMRFTIPVEARTKKNSEKIAGSGRRCPMCGKFEKQWIRQGDAHDAFAQAAAWYLRPQRREPISEPVNVCCVFFMATRRKVDLLNLLEAIDDLLVACGIILDDNCKIITAHDGSRVKLDRENPRVEISITPMPAGDYMT